MKNIKWMVVLLATIFIYRCNNVQKNENFAPVKNYPKNISIKTIMLEKLELEPVESSYIGELFVKNGSIGFIDHMFCWVFLFDKDGMFIERHLGQGHRSNEITCGYINGYACLNDGSFLFVGLNNNCYIYDNQFKTKGNIFINNSKNEKFKDYEQPSSYSLCYQNLIMKNYQKYLYYTIIPENENSAFIDSTKYFNNVHIIGKLNLKTGKTEKVLGNYPDVYMNDKSLEQLSFINFDIDSKGTFYLTFEADSLIYTFSKNFTPIKSFGYKGRDMNSLDNVDNAPFVQSRKEGGRYSSIVYIDETNILFRTYQKDSEKGGGLQIYKNSVLIGDLDVLDDFKILGYIYPYYYASCGIDEDDEKIILYKFKI